MKIVTWNVNSIRSRLDRVLSWLDRNAPDVLCLQELKCVDEQFPLAEIQAAGYHAEVYGQKAYNGVAILSRSEPTDVRKGFSGDVDDELQSQSRIISAVIDGVRVICTYVPNGSELTSDKFAYKLTWLGKLREMLDRDFDTSTPLLLCGDANVFMRDCDAAHPERWTKTVIACPEVRAAWANVVDWGLVDVFSKKHPEGGIYSWWNYRQLGFAKNNGLRLDYVYASPPLAEKCTSASVDRDERKGEKPSDHAPVTVMFG
ncbi:MAG: exodeoxyribonuclease III [Phycisphaerae bacterium]|nr:exodeoxyribonuclease III [Phycisphaerae bacterium]